MGATDWRRTLLMTRPASPALRYMPGRERAAEHIGRHVMSAALGGVPDCRDVVRDRAGPAEEESSVSDFELRSDRGVLALPDAPATDGPSGLDVRKLLA